ncbi:MAG: hypothetical protein K0R02_701 [Rickettsiaceae bacterium]|jgi:hypothetical protein|nr:hypothetical protein [Rickettsiaceae bacterium]
MNKYLIIFLIIFAFAEAQAIERYAQNFEANSKRRLEANIGEATQNRIFIEGDSILGVAGDESKYEWIADNLNTGNLFIIPKVKTGDRIELSLLTKSGLTQDLSLKVTNKDSHTIILTHPAKNKSFKTLQTWNDEQILQLIHGIYDPEKSRINRRYQRLHGMRLMQIREIEQLNIKCSLIKVINTTKEVKTLSKDTFVPFIRNVIALGIPDSKDQLNPGDFTTIILVTRKGA